MMSDTTRQERDRTAAHARSTGDQRRKGPPRRLDRGGRVEAKSAEKVAQASAAGTFLGSDRAELARFIEATFRHAEKGGNVSLRAFFDDKRDSPPFDIVTVPLNGTGLEPVIAAAHGLATRAARAERPVVVSPPIATFDGTKADEASLREGLVLSVELDSRAAVSLVALRAVLGPPTLVVESGGEWMNPETGEVEPKLHVHWRLKEPTRTPEEHARLKRARTFACELVGADGTSKPAVHPMRWAGTVHRKDPANPRLCRIVEHNPDAEIVIEDALAELEGLAILRGQADDGSRRSNEEPGADDDLLLACAEILTNPLPPKHPGGEPRGEWDEWNRIGMAFFRASEGSAAGLAAFDAWSRKNARKYDADATRARWEHYKTSPPTSIGAGTLVYEARRIDPMFRVKKPTAGPHEQASTATESEHPEPQPLPAGEAKVAVFDNLLLPDELRAWVADIAERMQCPPDYPAIATMIAAGSVVGRRVAIRPKRHDDWTVVANLWGAAIGRPGLMKTPAIQEPLRPLVRLEAEAKLAHEQRLKTHEAEARLASLEKKIREKDVEARLKAGGKPDRDTLVADLMAAGEEQQPPGRQRFIINDSTVEKLGEILRDNPNGVLHFRDELTGWLRSLEREGREGDRAFYLEAWNGSGRFTYDRIGRGTVDIEAACVSLLGGIQPGPLATYLGGVKTGGVADDGLLQRLQLLVWPDTPREWRLVDRRPDSEARERAFAVFKRLADIDPAKIGAQTADERELPFLRFDADAQAEFDTWRHGLEMRLRSGTVHPAFEAHLAKYRSLVPSIALICHLVNGAVGPVSLDACATAIAWAEYLESHAARIYGALLRSGDAAAGELAKHILAGDLGQVFTSREVQRHGWTGLTEREGVAEAIEILVELDWITERTLRTGGRPKTEYVVNPKVMERRP